VSASHATVSKTVKGLLGLSTMLIPAPPPQNESLRSGRFPAAPARAQAMPARVLLLVGATRLPAGHSGDSASLRPVRLLYVGVAPRRPGSLAPRDRGSSGSTSAGTSARRRSASASPPCSGKPRGWRPRLSGGGKVRLDRRDNAALSAWLREHLLLRWAVVRAPWRYEREVIAEMEPPMNRETTTNTRSTEARKRFRAAARRS
jgi:hypothetical protein